MLLYLNAFKVNIVLQFTPIFCLNELFDIVTWTEAIDSHF